MVQRVAVPSQYAEYEADETAWLERTAEALRAGRLGDIDPATLAEYLEDMAKRDKREVKSRLRVLLIHLLKWQYQPGKRTQSWADTVVDQRDELRDIFTSRSLRNHATGVLAAAYADARKRAAGETQVPLATFPAACPWDVDTMLVDQDDVA